MLSSASSAGIAVWPARRDHRGRARTGRGGSVRHRQLADLGARIIKIERPVDGDFAAATTPPCTGSPSHFVWLNRSKESLTLDVKRPEAARSWRGSSAC